MLNWMNMDAKRKRLREIMCELQGGDAKEGDKKQKRCAKKMSLITMVLTWILLVSSFIYPESGHYVQQRHHPMVRRNVDTKNAV